MTETKNNPQASQLGINNTNSKARTNGFYKIDFNEQTRVAGVGALIKSRLGFNCVGDGFIVRTEHRELLDKSKIEYKVVKE